MTQLHVSDADSKVVQVKLTQAPESASQPPAVQPAWVPFTLVAVEFGLLVLVLRLFALPSAAFANLAAFVWVGFVIHHFLPGRLRLPFFAALSVASIGLYAAILSPPVAAAYPPGSTEWVRLGLWPGLVNTAIVLAIGAGLLTICHLPIAWGARLGLLAVAVGGLVAVRFGVRGLSLPAPVWTILASLFMFRLMVYLYELYHRSAPTSPARAIAYFFMVPNVAFPLFPIVDYKTFCSSHYNAPALWIYQKGMQQILRGTVQLVLYRLVYHFGVIEVAAVTTLAELARFLVTTYLLYLRVSGSFHLIAGMLHLFGFNLPATNHFYYLASSFTDLWRRINIYWKDFIMKLFFNPAYFRLKRLGPTAALALATMFAFVATWWLHAYQLFWLQGTFPITWQDSLFWTILAVLVLINTLIESKRGRQRRLSKPRRTLWSETSLALRTIATFVTMCVLWTFWCRPSTEDVAMLKDAALNVSWQDIALVLGGLAGLGVTAVLFGHVSRAELEGTVGPSAARRLNIWPSAARVGLATLALLAIPMLVPRFSLSFTMAQVLTKVTSDEPSDLDREIQNRGYYEQLEGANIAAKSAKVGGIPQSHDTSDRMNLDEVGVTQKWVVVTKDFMHSELKPSFRGRFKGKLLTTNRWGMRDREYEKAKPAGVYRIALIGTSNEMGLGINDNESFENVVEDRLNREDVGADIQKFEILNFSRSGHGAFQKLYLLEDRIFEFEPDAVFWVTYSPEDLRMLDHLSKVVRLNYAIPDQYRAVLQGSFKKAAVARTQSDPQVQNRLKPFANELLQFVFQRFAEQCRQHGAQPFIVYRPEPFERPSVPKGSRTHLINLAHQFDMPVLDMTAAFENVSDRHEIMMDSRDTHVNERGHQLLADELYKQLHTDAGLRLRSPGR
jgi:hypothetical protein